mgnify:FL=1
MTIQGLVKYLGNYRRSSLLEDNPGFYEEEKRDFFPRPVLRGSSWAWLALLVGDPLLKPGYREALVGQVFEVGLERPVERQSLVKRSWGGFS